MDRKEKVLCLIFVLESNILLFCRAFIYNNVEQRYNLTSVDKNITYFVNGTVQYYEHKCFIINRPANATILVAQQDVNPMSPANSSSFHRILNFPKTAMENEFLVHPFAKKVQMQIADVYI